jgi:hypothetical protein
MRDILILFPSMPIHDHRLKESPPCPCCGNPTVTTTGVVDIPEGSGFLYVARWNPDSQDDGIMFLVGTGDPRGFISVRFDFELGGFNVVGPDNYDWQSPGIQVIPREQVSGTPLAPVVFRVLDEIWLNDPDLIEFVAGECVPEEEMKDGLIGLGWYSRAEARKLLDALGHAGIAASADFQEDAMPMFGFGAPSDALICVDPARRAEAEALHERVLGWKLTVDGDAGGET